VSCSTALPELQRLVGQRIQELDAIAGGAARSGQTERQQHGQDFGEGDPPAPAADGFPRSHGLPKIRLTADR